MLFLRSQVDVCMYVCASMFFSLFFENIKKKDNYNGGAQQNLRVRDNQAVLPSSSIRSINDKYDENKDDL